MGTSGALYYAVFNAIGYLAAGIIFFSEARRKGFSFDSLFYVLFGSLLGALIGSRLGSALFVYKAYYAKHCFDILIPQIGGKTLVGGLIGGYLGVVVTKKLIKFDRSTGDLFAPGIAIGLCIGRIGCFLNGCCYGVASSLPWAVRFQGTLRHPAQIYESIFCLFLFFYLWQKRKKIIKEGDLFKLFLLMYSFFRFWVEFLRADKVSSVFNLSLAQVIAGIVFVLTSIYFLKQKKASE